MHLNVRQKLTQNAACICGPLMNFLPCTMQEALAKIDSWRRTGNMSYCCCPVEWSPVVFISCINILLGMKSSESRIEDTNSREMCIDMQEQGVSDGQEHIWKERKGGQREWIDIMRSERAEDKTKERNRGRTCCRNKERASKGGRKICYSTSRKIPLLLISRFMGRAGELNSQLQH